MRSPGDMAVDHAILAILGRKIAYPQRQAVAPSRRLIRPWESGTFHPGDNGASGLGMSSEIEAVGAVTTAGLVASVVEPDGAHGHAHGACANCGTALRGPYCHACGQVGHLHRSMLHIVEEFFHGILHFDTKAWRTLPLLAFRPGKLTHDYIHGHRVRYVSPLALFLFTAFLMFMVFSMMGGGAKVAVPTSFDQAEMRASLVRQVEDAHEKRDRAEAALADQAATGADTRTQTQQRDQAQQDLTKAETALQTFDTTIAETIETLKAEIGTAAEEGGGSGAVSRALENLAKNDFSVSIGNKPLEAKIKEKLKNPDLLLYKLQNTAYKFSWMLIPISLPFLWLLFFWRRDVALYDHAIFSLYSLSFMSLLFITMSLLFKTGEGWLNDLGELLLFVPPVHMFFHLKGTYSLSTGSALWRTFALLVVTSITSLLFVLFILSIGFS